MFSKAFVINLPFKTDRLESFLKRVPACFGQIEVWPAVHGDSIRHPDWWNAGSGAWGCYRSHLQILEHCYQQKIESYIVFEDDAIFRPNAEDLVHEFMNQVPEDWEMIYLGGQLLHEARNPPLKVSEHVYIPYNVNRTHCFAVHRRGYEKVYKHLYGRFADREHIDHHLGRLHESGTLKIYVPGKWIVGQDGGPSNISGNNNAATFWVDPEKLSGDNREWKNRFIPSVFLEASISVAVELERRGWHRGHWQNEEKLDRGICAAIGSADSRPGLAEWRRAVTPEAVREGKTCICLHHPSLSWECVKLFEPPYSRIVAETADEAERQLRAIIDAHEAKQDKPQPVRNLIYHIYPKRGNGVWQWNVEQLVKRIDQFDGVRSVAIVRDDQTDSVDDVRAAFGRARIDNWIIADNDPSIGESATFARLLGTLPTDNSITFRAHAKGVRYDDPMAVREWTSMMYEVCLDDPDFIDASMEQYPTCGPFVVESGWPRPNRWHYSGAFFWFRSNVLSRPEAKAVELNYHAVELWPQTLWERNEVGVLFGQTCGRLYDGRELARMREWMVDFRSKKRPKPLKRDVRISVVIPTLGRPSLKSVVDELKRQLSDTDELLIVADGIDACEKVIEQVGDLDGAVSSVQNPDSTYGNAQRNEGMRLATGNVLWFVDDDDKVLPGAIDSIRASLEQDFSPTVFRMNHMGSILPLTPEITPGAIGGPMVVVPKLDGLPPFPVPAANPPMSDCEWIEAVNAWKSVRFSDAVIYSVEAAGAGR